MDHPSGSVRRFVTQVLALPVAVVVGVAVLVLAGAGGGALVAADGPAQQPGAANTKAPDDHDAHEHDARKHDARKHEHPGRGFAANPGLGHGCGHSAGKAKGHGVGLAHAPGQQPATCQAPGRLAGHGKPDKADR